MVHNLHRKEIFECHIDVGDDYCTDMAHCLAVDRVHLLNWGKVGKQVSAFVQDGVTSEDDADQRLQVRAITFRFGNWNYPDRWLLRP